MNNPPLIDFERCAIDAHFSGEDNDCAVKAVAIATQTAYQTVADIMGELGRKRGKPTHDYIMWQALRALGFIALSPVDGFPIDFNGEEVEHVTPIPRGRRKNFTFRSVPEVLDADGVYLVSSCNHVACYYRGEWQEGQTTGLQRVKTVWEVVPKI